MKPEPGIQEEDELPSGIALFSILTRRRIKWVFYTKSLHFHWQNPEENWPTESKPNTLTMAKTRLSHSVSAQIFHSFLQFCIITAGKMAFVVLGIKKVCILKFSTLKELFSLEFWILRNDNLLLIGLGYFYSTKKAK